MMSNEFNKIPYIQQDTSSTNNSIPPLASFPATPRSQRLAWKQSYFTKMSNPRRSIRHDCY